MIYRPTIISKIISTQANYIDRLYGQMFYYTDFNQIWYDTQDNNRILADDIIILQFERERNNYIPNSTTSFPTEPGMQPTTAMLTYTSFVYVVETNSLYSYFNGIWTTLYGTYGSTIVAQTYLPDGTIKTVNADDVTTNGILNDGSVVVRDNNKMICGLFRSDGYTLNMLSMIGGCINLDPSGRNVDDGCLQLTASAVGNSAENIANLNGNLRVFGNIETIPSTDWSKQYRLVTENIQIVTNTTIAVGSTLLATSVIGDTKYTVDTVITEQIEATSGMIAKGSKLYKDSIINQQLLQPPFMFDINGSKQKQIIPTTTIFSDDIVTISGSSCRISANTPFSNTGDCCYISGNSISQITSVVFTDKSYAVDYRATEGISSTAKIVYYSTTDSVKILP